MVSVKYEGPVEVHLAGRALTPDTGPIKPGDVIEVHESDAAQLVGDGSGFWSMAEKKAIAKPTKTGKAEGAEEVQSPQ